MASPKASGRMVRKKISESEKFASLSPEAAVLFVMLIPHFNAHGKMPGGPGVIKDEIVPLIPYFSYENLPQYLQEISDKTNVKWFRVGTKWWIHSLNFLSKHQDLRPDKLGSDDLPSYVPEPPPTGRGEEKQDEPTGRETPEAKPCGSSPGVVRDFPSRAEGLKVRREEEGLNPSSIGGGSSRPSRACEGKTENRVVEEEAIEAEVERLKGLHLQVCGLSSLPPVPIVREILLSGKSASLIDDVYQTHGGDIQVYRQRNIVDRLKALRDGRERDPPAHGGKGKQRKSAAELRQEATFAAAREFAGGCDDGGG